MKKNLFSILLVVVMTLAMVACGTQETTNDVPVSTETIEATVESDENSEAVSETEQATEAPVDEVVETVDETVESESSEATSETESDEVASTPDSEAVESEASEPETSEPEFTITEVTATKYATQSVNVRSGPSTDYDKIGGLTTNQEVQVTGQASTGWWRIQYNGGEAYVSDKYLADEKVEKPVDNSGSSGEQAQANSGTPEWTAGVLRENYGQYEDGTYWTYTCGVGAPTSSFWTNVCNIIDYEYIGRYNVNVYHLFNGEYKYSYLTDRDVYKVHCRNINCIYAMDN